MARFARTLEVVASPEAKSCAVPVETFQRVYVTVPVRRAPVVLSVTGFQDSVILLPAVTVTAGAGIGIVTTGGVGVVCARASAGRRRSASSKRFIGPLRRLPVGARR